MACCSAVCLSVIYQNGGKIQRMALFAAPACYSGSKGPKDHNSWPITFRLKIWLNISSGLISFLTSSPNFWINGERSMVYVSLVLKMTLISLYVLLSVCLSFISKWRKASRHRSVHYACPAHRVRNLKKMTTTHNVSPGPKLLHYYGMFFCLSVYHLYFKIVEISNAWFCSLHSCLLQRIQKITIPGRCFSGSKEDADLFMHVQSRGVYKTY